LYSRFFKTVFFFKKIGQNETAFINTGAQHSHEFGHAAIHRALPEPEPKRPIASCQGIRRADQKRRRQSHGYILWAIIDT